MDFFKNQIFTLLESNIVQKGSTPIEGISTDTRTLKPHNLFIALNGPNLKGSHFIQQALEKKASAILATQKDLDGINAPIPENITVFVCEDPFKTYQYLAEKYLQSKKNLLKIAITGSVGKTTVKEWTAQLLATKYKVFKNPGNLNSQTGIPFSIFQITDEEIAVFEVGTSDPGNLQSLCQMIHPDIGVIVSVGEAHLEFFGSIEAIANEKFTLAKIAKKSYAESSIPFQEKLSNTLFVNKSDVFKAVTPLEKDGAKIALNAEDEFNFPFFGDYNANNLALAVSIARELGVSDKSIAQVKLTKLPSFRNEKITVKNSVFMLDCYNASPLSMKAVLKEVHHFKPLPILILGDMLELGKESSKLHQELGLWLNTFHFPYIFFVGSEMKEAYNSYKGKKHWVEDILSIQSTLEPYLKTPQEFFLKGSRGMQLERILEFVS